MRENGPNDRTRRASADHGLSIDRPTLSLVVAWHPASTTAAEMAGAVFAHYRSTPFDRVAGATGISVIYRSAPRDGATVPADVNFTTAATTAILLLIDESWLADPAWVEWARALEAQCTSAGLHAQLCPVWFVPAAKSLNLQAQALRLDQWEQVELPLRQQRLFLHLTYQLCRMQRVALASQERDISDQRELEQYLEPVRVFLSHSKHDPDNLGQTIAVAIRDRMHAISDLADFFDKISIASGLPFDRVILHFVPRSAMVAIHTDSYSSREWCRIEMIEAKRAQTPLVVASAIDDMDERSFPYLGNVPVVRLHPMNEGRIDLVIGRLLDEVLRDLMWRYRVATVAALASPATVFLPRYPELIALAGRIAPGKRMTVVYPDPPLGAEEERVFADIAPAVELRSMTEWLAGARHAAAPVVA